jgi:NTP pyrophosphatase (non-canonical NTP hydrolase)
MNLTNEFEAIRQWADEKGILSKGDVKTQMVKLVEEMGELGKSIMKNDRDEFIDAIGDCVVVLTNIAALGEKYFTEQCETCHGEGGYYEDVAGDGGSKMYIHCDCEEEIKIEDCINSAYDVIAKRTGKMVNGTFVKD